MLNKDFLNKLDKERNKIIYARVSLIDFYENSSATLEGVITGGSISVDGASAVRRSCQLTMVTQDTNFNDYLWTLDSKFKLEIGVENKIDNSYPEIIWFNQGIYLITSFSSSLSTSNYTINLSGKDKMCLLNGEIGGSLPFEVDFGKYEQVDKDGNVKYIQYPLKDIIREAVHHYGGESFHNIIVNDLDNKGSELLEYRYDQPLYLIREAGNNVYEQSYLDGSIPVFVNGEKTTLAELQYYDTLIDNLIVDDNIQVVEFTWEENSEKKYRAAKISYGQTAGVRPTELVYTGDLIGGVGESITSILDKIKNMLGNYEYFYDLDGRFIFQEQKNYINTSWTPLTSNEEESYVDPEATRVIYNFSGNELITSFNNSPNISNLKNDYSVWGTRKSVNGAEIPIHMRYAIDQKPTEYNSITVKDGELKEYNEKYGFTLLGQDGKSYKTDKYDWRELIYQMALDYRKYNHLDDFELRVAAANPNLYPTGRTGYEQYYIDLEGFWRQLYNPEGSSIYEKVSVKEKDKIDSYYEKIDTYTKITDKPDNGTRVYKKVEDTYEPSLWTETGDYYTLKTEYKPVLPPKDPDSENTDVIEKVYIKDNSDNSQNNLYSYTADKERDVLCEIKEGSYQKATIGIVSNGPTVSKEIQYNAGISSDTPLKLICEFNGEDLTYEWYALNPGDPRWYKSNVADNTNIYSILNIKDDKNREGRKVYCKAIDKNGNSISTQPVTITGQPIYITKQPKNERLYFQENKPVSFDIIVSNSSNIKYSWYYKNQGDTEFKESETIIGEEYSLGSMTGTRIGRQVYCQITDTRTGYAIRSKTFTLLVNPESNNKIEYESYVKEDWNLNPDALRLSAKKNDKDETEVENGKLLGNERITLTVSIVNSSESNKLYYNWYSKKPNSNTYEFITQLVNNSTYSIGSAKRDELDGVEIFCVVQDELGRSAATTSIIIGFRPNLKIIKQPYSTLLSEDNELITSVTVNNKDKINYQWFVIAQDKNFYSTSTNTTSRYYDIRGPKEDYKDNRRVYCRITDTLTNQIVESDPAVFYKDKDSFPIISASPSYNGDKFEVVQAENENLTVTFKVPATITTSPITYKWYYANKDSQVFQHTTTYTNNVYDITMTKARSGRRIYCIAEYQKDGITYYYQSPTITIRLPKELKAVLKGGVGDKSTITCESEHEENAELEYEWCIDGEWVEKNKNTSYEASPGQRIKCKVSDNYGQSVVTNEINLGIDNQGTNVDGLATLEAFQSTGNWYYNPFDSDKTYYIPTQEFEKNSFWKKQVSEAPETLNFWFDFLDTTGDLNKFSTKVIGSRPKVVNDNDVKAIYYRDIPQATFDNTGSSTNGTPDIIQISPQYKNMFTQSAQGKSAKEAIDTLLYNHSHCAESISITSIPIYYLEPNRRIYINDENTKINGEYIISKFTSPLTYNGVMNITATKVVDRLI